MDVAGGIAIFDDKTTFIYSFLEDFVDIAMADAVGLPQIRRPLFHLGQFEEFFVFVVVFVQHHWRIQFDGFLRIEERRQLPVFDLDQFAGGASYLRSIGGHACDWLADKAHPVASQQVFIQGQNAHAHIRNFRSGDNCAYSGQFFGLAGVNPDNLGVGHRTALDFRVDQPRQLDIYSKLGGASDFFNAVDAFG